MGQLTNQYVSQSYQGLLNLNNANTGLTANLQTVTDGLGGSSPLQISQTQVNISGTFTVNGSPIVATDTGSLMKTGSVANDILTFTKGDGSTFSLAVTSSLPAGVVSGSQQIIDLGFATTSSLNDYTTTSSFNSYTSSNDNKVNSLINATGSYATTSSLTSLSQSIATTDLGQDNRLGSLEGKTGSYATTGSNNFVGQQNINGSVNVTGSLNVTGEITALSASITYLETIYQTSSVIFSSGSNILGDQSSDTQTLYGTVVLPNLNQYSGSTSGDIVTWNNISQRLEYTNTVPSASYSLNATSASHAINADTASFATTTVSSSYAENAGTSSYAQDIFVVGKNTTGGQLTKGTVVRIGGATGDQALIVTASWENDGNSANTLGILAQDIANDASGSVITNGTLLGINTSGFTAGDILYLSSSGQYTNVIPPAPYHEVRLGQVLRVQQNQGSMYVQIQNGYELTELHDVDITSPVSGDLLVYRSGSYGQWVNETGGELGFATTGSNNFIGTENITGSLNVSGSASITQNLRLFSSASFAATIQPGAYITQSSPVSQSNILFSQGAAIDAQGPLQVTATGSIVLSGSNNILFASNRVNTLINQGTYGYIGGNNNIVASIPTLTTSSLTRPSTANNFLLGGSVSLNSGDSGSLLFGSTFNNNTNIANLILSHPSGNFTYNGNYHFTNANLTSTQAVTPGKSNATFQGNLFTFGASTLNHISSSITFNNNIAGGLTINNLVSSSFSNATNGITFGQNIFAGSSNAFFVSGSASSAQTRQFNGNIIVGNGNAVSSSAVASNNAHLNYTAILGYQLIVSASNANNTGGSAFLGRFNGIDNGLDSSQNIVLAVGTGTPGNRRTGFWIDSGSFTNVSGALNITGSATSTVGFTGSLQGTASYASQALSASWAPDTSNRNGLITTGSLAGTQTILGTLRISGSSPLQVGTENNVGKINTYGGSNWLYRNSSNYNTVIGNVAGVDNGFFGSSEKNMILNGFFTPFATGSNNVIIQGAGDDFISGSNNIFIGSHANHAGGIGSVLIGSTSYPSGSIFNSKFELGTQNDSRIFHKDSAAPLQIGYDTQVTGSFRVSNGLTASGSAVVTGSVQGNVTALTISSNTASLDLNLGNFYTLQLVSGSACHINPSNIKPGQTVNIRINTTGSATVNFPSSVKQVSGSSYVPTTSTGVDVITLVSFDSSDLYLANVKNLI